MLLITRLYIRLWKPRHSSFRFVESRPGHTLSDGRLRGLAFLRCPCRLFPWLACEYEWGKHESYIEQDQSHVSAPTRQAASSFASGLAAAYVIYPPQLSIWIHDPSHVAELGFIVLLAITASKAVGVIVDGKPLGAG